MSTTTGRLAEYDATALAGHVTSASWPAMVRSRADAAARNAMDAGNPETLGERIEHSGSSPARRNHKARQLRPGGAVM